MVARCPGPRQLRGWGPGLWALLLVFRQLGDLVRRHQRGGAVVRAGPLGQLSAFRLVLPLFTLALGLLDGFNPCAMWVLLFLLVRRPFAADHLAAGTTLDG